ncbi:unnamed protein product [Soboliphyme baturini]|uniref:Transmembrane protein 87A n=1 Tax=Soboliphyme baturini TaxID=241478 RepID=A0A183IEC8_9BILA|nr:unnamed protein product [Soboliphyme baturini]
MSVVTCVIVLWFCSAQALLELGIEHEVVTMGSETQFYGFQRSAFKDTEVQIRTSCSPDDESSGTAAGGFSAEVTVRSTPCAKEYVSVLGSEQQHVTLKWYANKRHTLPDGFDYSFVYIGKTDKAFDIKCNKELSPVHSKIDYMEKVQVTKDPDVENLRRADEAMDDDDDTEIEAPPKHTVAKVWSNSTSSSVGSWQPIIKLPVDAIYLVIVKVTPHFSQPHNFTIEVQWKATYGYLGAIDWPLLPFYGVMCGVYGFFGILWLIFCFLQWRDLLRIQYWIGAVIFLGMLEKTMFYAEYQIMNTKGYSYDGVIQAAELISSLKKTVSRILVIIVSIGFGVVKPRLGSTLHRLVGLGIAYFVLSYVESIYRISKLPHDTTMDKLLVKIPLTLIDMVICYWIFSALVNTTRNLRLRRNEVKLALYRHFTNTLIFAVTASLIFMFWSLAVCGLSTCLSNWQDVWLDVAFWHILFCLILFVIIILWRPTKNNQRYAFSPLLDNETDDDDDGTFSAIVIAHDYCCCYDWYLRRARLCAVKLPRPVISAMLFKDTLFSEAFTKDDMKLRSSQRAQNQDKSSTQPNLEDELKWVDEHIPTALTDKALPALLDSDEEAEKKALEISKIL